MKLAAGQTAVVTGAASGIGLALAKAFAARCDVSLWAEVEALRDAALSRFGRIEIVCNNAGVILPFQPMWTHTQGHWDWLLDINLQSVVHGIRNSPRLQPGADQAQPRQEDSATKPIEASRGAIAPETVAALAIEGIEADRLHIFTNSGSSQRVDARINRLLADLN